VKDFGAKGDRQSHDHPAIQAAIDACFRTGGGTVEVPSGTYLCGTIHMRSNVSLRLEEGAVLLGSDHAEHYPEICKTPYGNLPGQIQALIWADEAENVTICGSGVIDGGGSGPLPPEVAKDVRFRPALIFYRNCQNVKFLDVTMRNSCFWTLHLMRCEYVSIRGITIRANLERINTDGIDPDGCRNVTISDCIIETGDDSIVIKSTEGDVCENIVVSNCLLRSRQAALKIGTEAIGDIRNVSFNNCTIYGSRVALALYMKDGSRYENILFSHMNIEADHDFPIIVDVTPRYYRRPAYGKVRNVAFDNLMITAKGRCYLEGWKDHPLENIAFRNITWVIDGNCKTDVRKPTGARRVELDPNGFDYASQPYHFIAAHAAGLQLHNIRLVHAEPGRLPDRGILFAKEVRDLSVSELHASGVPDGMEPVKLENATS
jgi:hypothetical protein